MATVVLAAIVGLLFFATPALDDFCKASLSYFGKPQASAADVTWLYYQGWSARWASTLLQSVLFGRVDLIRAYPWLLLLVWATNIGALYLLFRAALRLPPFTTWSVSGMFYVAWILSIPSAEENVFWATGATEYHLPLAGLLVLTALLLRNGGKLAFVAALVLAFLIPAQHEVGGLLACLILAIGIVATKVLKIPSSRWIACFVVACASLLIVIAAPAGHARALSEGRHLWDFRHAPAYAFDAFKRGAGWLIAPIPLLTAVCISLFAGSMRGTRELPLLPRWVAPLCLLGMVLTLASVITINIASGGTPPTRLVAWYQWVFWLLLVFATYSGIPELIEFGASHTLRDSIVTASLAAILVLSVFTSTAFKSVAKDLQGPARTWATNTSQQLSGRNGPAADSRLSPKPANFVAPGLSDDPAYWVNVCWVNYVQK